MDWIFFAAIYGIFSSIGSLVSRKLMKGQDPLAMSMVFSSIFVFLLFFVKEDFSLILKVFPWFLLSGISVMGANILVFTLVKKYPVSITKIFSKLSIFWVSLGGWIFFGETFSSFKIIGIILIVFGSFYLIKNGIEFKGKLDANVLLLILMGVLLAIFILSQKQILETLSPVAALSIGSSLVTLFHLFIPGILPKVKNLLIKIDLKLFLIFIAFSMIYNLSLVFGLKIQNPALFSVTARVFSSFTLIGEYFFLKDKVGIKQRAIAFILTVIGFILINLHF